MSDLGINDTDDCVEQPSGTETCFPRHVEDLREQLSAFLRTDTDVEGLSLGKVACGVYAFFDLDKEPLYVGQTSEQLSVRIQRHLTGQRSDAVAKNILDPLEVCFIQVWPLTNYQPPLNKKAKKHLDALEYAIYRKVLISSTFAAVFNEKQPAKPAVDFEIPPCYFGKLRSPEVAAQLGHPDIRIARRAQTLSALAKGISERQVEPEIRRVLALQSERLNHLIKTRWVKVTA
jgi:hypothetical protein